jgi:hypothetical protein
LSSSALSNGKFSSRCTASVYALPPSEMSRVNTDWEFAMMLILIALAPALSRTTTELGSKP